MLKKGEAKREMNLKLLLLLALRRGRRRRDLGIGTGFFSGEEKGDGRKMAKMVEVGVDFQRDMIS